MLANDASKLDAILDPRLHFAHANGGVDDKQAYLTKMAAGRIIYEGIRWSEDVVMELGPDVAMLTGKMITNVKVDGVEKTLKNCVISIWVQTNQIWRLIAFQSTPMAS
jgi:hypothetical protein